MQLMSARTTHWWKVGLLLEGSTVYKGNLNEMVFIWQRGQKGPANETAKYT